MAVFVLKNAYVKLNNVDLSDHVKKVTLNYKAADEDSTVMGATAKGRIAGLLDGQISIEFAQDFASNKVDATLFGLVGAAAFAFEIRPDAGAVGATNPKFTGNCILTDYAPVDGTVGSLATVSAALLVDGAITRATS